MKKFYPAHTFTFGPRRSEKKGSFSFRLVCALCQSSAVGFVLRKCECFEKRSPSTAKEKIQSPFSECSPVKGYQTEKRPLRLQCKRARDSREIDARSLSSHTSNLYFYIMYNTAPGAPPASLSNSPEDPSCELDERRFSQSLVVPFFVGFCFLLSLPFFIFCAALLPTLAF